LKPVAGDRPAKGHPACDYDEMEEARKKLPGWKEPIDYFDIPAMTSLEEARLSSTPLACGQLSAATYGDPTHNDLMSALDPIRTTAKLSDHQVRRLVGYRVVTTTNGDRICEWSKMVDRDGEKHFFGLNFRGQILVHAIQEQAPAQGGGANFIFHETLKRNIAELGGTTKKRCFRVIGTVFGPSGMFPLCVAAVKGAAFAIFTAATQSGNIPDGPK